LKKPVTERAGYVTHGVGPEFKPQHRKKNPPKPHPDQKSADEGKGVKQLGRNEIVVYTIFICNII
jgi:hypothetical protein